MGLIIRRRFRIGKRNTVNVSKSGVSVTRRTGRLSVNSRGGGSVRIARGVYFRWGKH